MPAVGMVSPLTLLNMPLRALVVGMTNELPSAAAPAEKVVPALADISLAFSNASPVCAATDSAGGRPFRKVLVVVAYNPTNVTLTVGQ